MKYSPQNKTDRVLFLQELNKALKIEEERSNRTFSDEQINRFFSWLDCDYRDFLTALIEDFNSFQDKTSKDDDAILQAGSWLLKVSQLFDVFNSGAFLENGVYKCSKEAIQNFKEQLKGLASIYNVDPDVIQQLSDDKINALITEYIQTNDTKKVFDMIKKNDFSITLKEEKDGLKKFKDMLNNFIRFTMMGSDVINRLKYLTDDDYKKLLSEWITNGGDIQDIAYKAIKIITPPEDKNMPANLLEDLLNALDVSWSTFKTVINSHNLSVTDIQKAIDALKQEDRVNLINMLAEVAPPHSSEEQKAISIPISLIENLITENAQVALNVLRSQAPKEPDIPALKKVYASALCEAAQPLCNFARHIVNSLDDTEWESIYSTIDPKNVEEADLLIPIILFIMKLQY